MTKRIERASQQPKQEAKPGEAEYPAGPGNDHGNNQEKVHVVVPEEPPLLSPEAARALLRIIRTAYAQQLAADEHQSSCEGGNESDDANSC